MKSLIKKVSGIMLLIPALVLGVSFAAPVANAACDPNAMTLSSGADCAQGTDQPGTLFGSGADDGLFKKVVNIMLFIVGAVAVIMLILGGVKYVTSGGAQDKVTSAKNTIMYAIIGIVVAVLAYAVVNFVVSGLKTT